MTTSSVDCLAWVSVIAMSASVGGPECTKLKKEYDECFNDWYTNGFLNAKSNTNECEDLFIDYKECVMNALKQKEILPLLEQARQESPFDAGEIGIRAATRIVIDWPRRQIFVKVIHRAGAQRAEVLSRQSAAAASRQTVPLIPAQLSYRRHLRHVNNFGALESQLSLLRQTQSWR